MSNVPDSRDRSGNTYVRNEHKIAANSTIQMRSKVKMLMLLKIEIGNFIFCNQ